MIKTKKIIDYTIKKINEKIISNTETIKYVYTFFPNSNFKLLFNKSGIIKESVDSNEFPINKYTIFVIKLNKNGIDLYNKK